MPPDVTGLEFLVEKYGLPGLVIAVLVGLVWRFAPARRAEAPEAQMAAALKDLAEEVADMRTEMTDRFARLETNVENLKDRK